jgi:hypothetical protein
MAAVLTTVNKDSIVYNDSPKRPKTVPCKIFHISRDKQEYFILIGHLNNQAFECFAGKNHNHVINKKVVSGDIVKLASGRYRLELPNGDEVSPLKAFIEKEEEVLTRMVSMSLRHGARVEYIVGQLEKASGDLQSLAKAISRALKSFITDGTTGEECPECSQRLIFTEGCQACPSCGFSKC